MQVAEFAARSGRSGDAYKMHALQLFAPILWIPHITTASPQASSLTSPHRHMPSSNNSTTNVRIEISMWPSFLIFDIRLVRPSGRDHGRRQDRPPVQVRLLDPELHACDRATEAYALAASMIKASSSSNLGFCCINVATCLICIYQYFLVIFFGALAAYE
jgi:hypothetical protein